MALSEKLDKSLFELINGDWHNNFFDYCLPLVRSPQLWIPLYLFLLIFVSINMKENKWWWILFFGILPVFTDFISSDLIKEHFYRLRPCNDPNMNDSVRFLLSYKPQSSSFTSSHATNHFALAAFFYFTLKKYFNKWGLLFFCWAFMICYAQVYVGVHYPFDVICGGIIGFSIGYGFARFFNLKFQQV